MDYDYKALIGSYPKEPFKWTSLVDKPKHQGSNDTSFEDNLIELFSSSARRTGRTHIMVRAFVHIAIMERRTVYFMDHNDSVRITKRNDDNFRRAIEEYVHMLKQEGVEFEVFNMRETQLNLIVSPRNLDIYFKARQTIRERQPSFPNRVNPDRLQVYRVTPDNPFPYHELVKRKDELEEILLIINKK